MTALWNTTTGPCSAAASTSAGSSSSRSPRTSAGGSARATSIAWTQLGPAVVVLGPDQHRQPVHLVGVGDVERVEVDARRARRRPAAGPAAAPVPRRERRAPGPAPIRRTASAGRPRVRVAVRVEAEPGATPRPPAARAGRDRPPAANAGTRVASRPASLVWVARSRMVRRIVPSSSSSARRSASYGPGAATPCQRAAAKTRFGCRLGRGSASSQPSTSASSATRSDHSSKHGE